MWEPPHRICWSNVQIDGNNGAERQEDDVDGTFSLGEGDLLEFGRHSSGGDRLQSLFRESVCL